MTLRAQLLLQVPKATSYFCAEIKCLFPFSNLSSRSVQSLSTMRNSWQNKFRHHVGICVLPCNCASTLPILSCVSLHFHQGASVTYVNILSMQSCTARRCAHCVRVRIQLPAHQYMDDTTQAQPIFSEPHCCHTAVVVTHRNVATRIPHAQPVLW